MNINWKGWRTVAYGLAMAIGPSALTYLMGVDWTKLVSPNAAAVIGGIGVVVLRAVTSTPLGKSE